MLGQVAQLFLLYGFALDSARHWLSKDLALLVAFAVCILQSTFLFLANRNSFDPAVAVSEMRPNRWSRAVSFLYWLVAVALLASYFASAIRPLFS